jgi:Zn-dependent peptidase ImmA (M78 family)
MSELLLEKEASEFRANQGLDSDDSIRLKSLLQKANVITVFAPLTSNFSGMAIKALTKDNKEGRFVLINSNQSLGKQHFTICHELYHLFVQKNFTSQVCNTGAYNKNDINEYKADVFAGYFLLPTDGLLKNIPNDEIAKKKISLKTILYIEQLYSCSRRALLYRLKNLKLVSSNEYETYTKNIVKGALENGYSTDLYYKGNENVVIGDYGTLARSFFDREKISETHYYTLLADLGVDTSKIIDAPDAEP